LLIALHGGHGTGKRMIDLTMGGFDTLADQENFIVVYPNGIGKNWNDGRLNLPASYKAHNRNIDDVGFISALIDELVKTKNVDPKRVYVTGMSNGALMTHRLAIELSDKIAAAAPVCGNIPADLKSTPMQSVAVMMINGTSDPLVPYDGGFVHFKKKKLGQIFSTNESVTFWVKNNGISSSPKVAELPNTNISDSCHVRKTTYGEASDAGEVELITIECGGHTWAGGLQYLNEKWIGRTCFDINACDVIWEFCKTHSK
jgi:polyhydroxybutyrate depolymerase